MEFWSICYKCIVLIYVIISANMSESALSPWYMLSVLLYLCANLSVHIAKLERMKPMFLLVSIALIIVSAYHLHPLLWLLLPMNLYELVMCYTRKYAVAVLPMLAPMVLLPDDMLMQYGLIAVIGFAYYTMVKTHEDRMTVYRDDLEMMRDRTNILSKSLVENNEYIRQSEYTFKLEERNRLAQEIHDKISHSMTGALIQMEAAKRLLAADPDKSAELLQNAIQISKDGIESIRLVLKNMKPPTEQLGINRLRLLIDEFSTKHAGIRTSLTHEGNIDILTPIQWKIAMENIKEALTNAMKYSNATAISVHIQVLSTLIKVEVSDNGKGARKIIKGMGISGMEERTAGVNGKVIVDGSRGFSVTTLLPYGP